MCSFLIIVVSNNFHSVIHDQSTNTSFPNIDYAGSTFEDRIFKVSLSQLHSNGEFLGFPHDYSRIFFYLVLIHPFSFLESPGTHEDKIN